MLKFSKHRWSWISIGVSTIMAVTVVIIHHLHSEGRWHSQSRLSQAMIPAGGLALLIWFVTALIGIVEERPSIHAIVALILSILIFFYIPSVS
jgi:hypothetical protein